MNTAELSWFKSSYSGPEGDNCLEVAFTWRRSGRSHACGDGCVEVAVCPGTVHIRDSKVTTGPRLALSPAAWTAFVGHAARS